MGASLAPEVLPLSPALRKDLPLDTQRRLVADLVAVVESEAAAQRERTGSQVLGVAAICRQRPHHRPAKSKKSPAPLFSAFSRWCARSSTKATHGSWPRTGRPPRSFALGTVRCRSRPAASHLPCHSWPGSPLGDGTLEDPSARDQNALGRVVSTRPHFHRKSSRTPRFRGSLRP